jgi:nanoRNase/pAp phosphatase (c-di-AMP/oligoRNAs hydrolase)
MSRPRRLRSERLLETLSDCEEVLVITHDNPDPDAIAAGWAIDWLVSEKLGKPVRLVGGGDIIRAENRHMVKLLDPPIELVNRVHPSDGTGAVLVDCGLGAQNHLLRSEKVSKVAVIDHHALNGDKCPLAFRDIRPQVAASASIAASYLREQNLVPSTELATAMMYAIRTETRGSETHYSRLDRSILLWLAGRADLSQLAEIEDAPLSPEYYGDLVLALQNTRLYEDAGLCLLPRANSAEIVGEVADLLIRCQVIKRVLCGAVVRDDLLLSCRTERDGEDAAKLVRRTLNGLGQGGGHRHRAGGVIRDVGPGSRIGKDLQEEIRDRWLAACGVDWRLEAHLIGRYEIVANL